MLYVELMQFDCLAVYWLAGLCSKLLQEPALLQHSVLQEHSVTFAVLNLKEPLQF
jgi:hypothetical protein